MTELGLQGPRLLCQISPFQVQQPVWTLVVKIFLGQFFFDPRDKALHMSHRTRDDNHIGLQFSARTCEPSTFSNPRASATALTTLIFANGIDQMKFVSEKNGQWNTRKTAACAHIKHYLSGKKS